MGFELFDRRLFLHSLSNLGGLGLGSLTNLAHTQVLLVLALFALALEHLVGLDLQLFGGRAVAGGIHGGQLVDQSGGQTGICQSHDGHAAAAEEEAKLLSESPDRYAKGIYDGIINFFDNIGKR